MFKNTINAAAIMYAREIDPRARFVDETTTAGGFEKRPYALDSHALRPAAGPVAPYAEVWVVLPSKASKARGIGGMRRVLVHTETLSCLGVVA